MKKFLEKTILEMGENSQLSEKFICKLTKEHEQLLKEATAILDELNSYKS